MVAELGAQIGVYVLGLFPAGSVGGFRVAPVYGVAGLPGGQALKIGEAAAAAQFLARRGCNAVIGFAVYEVVYALAGMWVYGFFAPAVSLAHQGQQALDGFLRISTVVVAVGCVVLESVDKTSLGQLVGLSKMA